MEYIVALMVAEIELEISRFCQNSGRKIKDSRQLLLPNNDNESHDDAIIGDDSV
jgi:hypothetical protein